MMPIAAISTCVMVSRVIGVEKIEEEIKKNTEYTNNLLDVSNDIIVFNLLDKNEENKITIEQVEKGNNNETKKKS